MGSYCVSRTRAWAVTAAILTACVCAMQEAHVSAKVGVLRTEVGRLGAEQGALCPSEDRIAAQYQRMQVTGVPTQLGSIQSEA